MGVDDLEELTMSDTYKKLSVVSTLASGLIANFQKIHNFWQQFLTTDRKNIF